jgi:DNA mismatch repair protein MutL
VGKIKLLSEQIINQIAAGEIVERPCSALKEVVENSIDAGAKNVYIFLKNGGKTKMVVEDDGEGLSSEDLSMCILRHATSKLSGMNLFEIQSYGFRGEALPSIASVSRFSIESNGLGLTANFSEVSDPFPSKITGGTVVTIEDLFSRIPARLKFMKSDGAELSACISVIENFAIIHRDVNFTVRSDDKCILSFQNDTLPERIARIFGRDIFERSIYFEEEDGTIVVKGYLFHPLDSKYSQEFQRTFVNGRIVRDKTISASIRNAYRDLVIPGRFAVSVIFIEIDPFYVDVNVSPTKSEIRFRDPRYVQKMLTDSIRRNLQRFDKVDRGISSTSIGISENKDIVIDTRVTDYLIDESDLRLRDGSNSILSKISFSSPIKSERLDIFDDFKMDNEFGEPLCQIFDSYIVAEKGESIILIDQHAVHEKITQEKILKELKTENKQHLLNPEIIELTRRQKEFISENEHNITQCGFEIQINNNLLMVSAVPAVMDIQTAILFINDIADSKEDLLPIDVMRHKIADIACHNSIRAGRKMSHGEMQAMLKQMEETKSIHQCNHHRPSFIRITKEQIEKMFHRR